jgi:hypothetical protein
MDIVTVVFKLNKILFQTKLNSRTKPGLDFPALPSVPSRPLASKQNSWTGRRDDQQNSGKRILDCIRPALHSCRNDRQPDVHQGVAPHVLHPDISGREVIRSGFETNIHSRMDKAGLHERRDSFGNCFLLFVGL